MTSTYCAPANRINSACKIFARHRRSTMLGILALTLGACATPAETTRTAEGNGGQGSFGTPVFEEFASAAGLDHTYQADADFVVGGGGAAFDCDGDRDADLILAGGTGSVALFRNVTGDPGIGPDITFKRVTAFPATLGAEARRVTGTYALDVDGDGIVDLALLRFGRNRFLKGLGDCRFEVANAAWGLTDTGTWSTALAATWQPGMSHPTIAIGNYVDRSKPLEKTGNCEPGLIARPAPGGVGTRPQYGSVQDIRPSHCPLSMLFVDWRGDGRPDLRISNDRQYADPDGAEQLVRLAGSRATPYSAADGWVSDRIWGMGLAATDIDGDGHPEIAATNMAENRLYTLAKAGPSPRPTFEDRAWPLGASAQRPYSGGDPRPSTSWHTTFADFNADGYQDLLIIKGNVDTMKQFAAYDPDSLLLGTPEGRFVEVGDQARIDLNTMGRGGAVADFDRDGCLDIVVVNRNQPVSFFRNMSCPDKTAGNSLSVRLIGTDGNTRGVGARLELEADGRLQTKDVTVGGGHGGASLVPTHFGLGSGDTARLRVRWPNDDLSSWFQVRAGNHYAYRQGAPKPLAQ